MYFGRIFLLIFTVFFAHTVFSVNPFFIDNPKHLAWNQFIRVIQLMLSSRTKLIIPVNGLYKLTRGLGGFRSNLTIRLEDICKNSWKFSGESRPSYVEKHTFSSLEQSINETITWYKQQGLI